MLGKFIISVKRADTPFFGRIKAVAKWILCFNPPVPALLFPLLRGMMVLKTALMGSIQKFITTFVRYPCLRAMCESIGPRLYLERLPSINPGVNVRFGADVEISGVLVISTASVFSGAVLTVGNRVFLGHPAVINVGKSVVIEDDVLIAGGCSISDYCPHPMDPDRRAEGLPPDPDSAKPVRICRKAWIGMRSIILPGVTIGEGAIVGAGTVVTKDVPPYCTCVGAPARMLYQNSASQTRPSRSDASDEVADHVR